MLCPHCSEKMQTKRGRYQYRESGLDNVWLTDWPMFVCRKCKIEIPLVYDAEHMAKEIIPGLLRTTSGLSGNSIVFLRKALGFKAGILAERLHVDRVTVSRWENDKRTIERDKDFRLRLFVIEQIFPNDRQLKEDVFELFKNPPVTVADKRPEPVYVSREAVTEE